MEIGSSGAGSLVQVSATQTGSAQEINRAQQTATLESPAAPETQAASPPPSNKRVGSIVDVTV